MDQLTALFSKLDNLPKVIWNIIEEYVDVVEKYRLFGIRCSIRDIYKTINHHLKFGNHEEIDAILQNKKIVNINCKIIKGKVINIETSPIAIKILSCSTYEKCQICDENNTIIEENIKWFRRQKYYTYKRIHKIYEKLTSSNSKLAKLLLIIEYGHKRLIDKIEIFYNVLYKNWELQDIYEKKILYDDNVEMVKFLMNKGIEFNENDLHKQIKNNNSNVAKYMVSNKPQMLRNNDIVVMAYNDNIELLRYCYEEYKKECQKIVIDVIDTYNIFWYEAYDTMDYLIRKKNPIIGYTIDLVITGNIKQIIRALIETKVRLPKHYKFKVIRDNDVEIFTLLIKHGYVIPEKRIYKAVIDERNVKLFKCLAMIKNINYKELYELAIDYGAKDLAECIKEKV